MEETPSRPTMVDAVASFRPMSLFPAACLGVRPDLAAHLRDQSLQQPCLRRLALGEQERRNGVNRKKHLEKCGIILTKTKDNSEVLHFLDHWVGLQSADIEVSDFCWRENGHRT